MKEKLHNHSDFLSLAVSLAHKNVALDGGPFGAVVVRNGEIIAEGTNHVTQKNDPTAHAEVEAIRAATQKLGHFQLKGCILYSSCEPCPMCLGAIYWAGIDRVYFASNRNDAEMAGFSDALIYNELGRDIEHRRMPTINLRTENTGIEFKAWAERDDKITY
jgi:guanine deaminase